ncbi:hypothetical protein [Thauera sinica]|uniref:Transposase n=1 Tax=Thauera sinica TaxID=2665146 RepID=A0ABW1AUT8_9RHOO|nr:hypothetical protein [Thauera sp. K11]
MTTHQAPEIFQIPLDDLDPAGLPPRGTPEFEQAVIGRYALDCPASWRIEVVSLALETRHGVWVAQVPIKPKGISKKKRTIGVPEFRHYTEV